ncbi:pectate lyase family protein [Novipirellula sp. SH528]|uniref:pectate lyase family protein n=1 Tax=Novipirellula sp. SH528 TaxID=3454466 RepID=UPI003F9FFD09
MKISLTHIVLQIALLLAVSATPLVADGELPAFPGAEGFGAETPGGRGGQVIEVTTLDDDGPGSFRAACEAKGARIVVFRTGGMIEVHSPIVILEPFITIAGQTAPGDGITLKAAPEMRQTVVQVATHDVVIRGLRVRRGPSREKTVNGDAISIHNVKAVPQRIVIDHCSISWGTDENLDAWYSASDITIQWCVISEALENSSHPKGPHSKGTLMGSDVRRVSYHHNLLAHNVARNPQFSNNEGPDHIINNVVYNWKYFGSQFSTPEKQAPKVNLIGNTYRAGPDTRTVRYEVQLSNYPKEPLFYVRDNVGPHRPDGTADEWALIGDASSELGKDQMLVPAAKEIQRQEPWPASPIPVTIHPSGQAYELVLDQAGVTVPRRDAVDKRVIADVRSTTGRCIDDPSDVGGWPKLDPGTPPADADHDGMPDQWEKEHGLDPHDANDRNGKVASGFTRIEEYLNSLFRP